MSPKVLAHDLALTMTLQGELDQDLSITRDDIERHGSPDDLIGRSFGHFEIVNPLGQGGMGQVYRALDKSLQRYVAVKVLRSGIGSSLQTSASPKLKSICCLPKRSRKLA